MYSDGMAVSSLSGQSPSADGTSLPEATERAFGGESERDPRYARNEAVDVCKGLAILAVVAIHAELLRGTIVFLHLINRAVPVFLLLFGLTSELWWQKHAQRGVVGKWYRKRFGSLLPGVWAVMSVWWIARALFGGLPTDRAGVELIGATIGYSPFYGTGWFVVLIVQMIVLFPLVRRAVVGLGPVLAVGLAAACSAFFAYYALYIMEWGQAWLGSSQRKSPLYFDHIFSPRVAWHVTMGIVLARTDLLRKRTVVLLSGALVLLGPLFVALVTRAADNAIVRPLYKNLVMVALDVPLTIVLLDLLGAVRLPSAVRRFLIWCGGATWGLYLGHTLIYETAHLAGLAPETGGPWVKLFYALVLFGAAACFTELARRLVRRRPAAAVATAD